MGSLAFFLLPVVIVVVAAIIHVRLRVPLVAVILLAAYRRASAPAGLATLAPTGAGVGV
jgi:hypothetical protein